MYLIEDWIGSDFEIINVFLIFDLKKNMVLISG